MPIPQVPSPLQSILAAKTYNAAWFSGATIEAQIQNAITSAIADGATAVFVPANMQGFDITLISLNSGIALLYENLSRLSADRGDASITIKPGTDVEFQRFATALTANRTVTLGTGHLGAFFRVVRTGLGAFTLDVGGLKTIASATAAFVDVAHDGTAWRLVGYGAL